MPARPVNLSCADTYAYAYAYTDTDTDTDTDADTDADRQTQRQTDRAICGHTTKQLCQSVVREGHIVRLSMQM